MAVTTGTYTTAGTNYTPAQLATAVGTALIDSGIMAGWFYSATSGGNEIRVLEVTYDATKTYGKTYYCFFFSGADMFCSVSSGWNTGSGIPSGVGGAGTQYLDWFSTTISAANSCRITASTTAGFNNTQTAPIKRYTSGANPNFSIIQMLNGTTTVPWAIVRTAPTTGMVDLNVEFYTSMVFPRLTIGTSNPTAQAAFQLFPMRTRRSHLGRPLRGNTNVDNYGYSATAVFPWSVYAGTTENFLIGMEYGAVGNISANNANNTFTRSCIQLPVQFSNVNPLVTTDQRPPFHTLPLNAYSSFVLPSDFAFIPVYNNNTMQVGGTIQISAGTEEWEIISVVNASATGNPSMAFCARTVGS